LDALLNGYHPIVRVWMLPRKRERYFDPKEDPREIEFHSPPGYRAPWYILAPRPLFHFSKQLTKARCLLSDLILIRLALLLLSLATLSFLIYRDGQALASLPHRTGSDYFIGQRKAAAAESLGSRQHQGIYRWWIWWCCRCIGR